MSHLDKWQGRSAIVVDDSPSHRLVAAELLRDVGFSRVYEAENGIDALRKLDQLDSLDLVVTDLNMPGMDGVKLLERIAAGFKGKVHFVAVMSGVPRDVLDTVQGVVDASDLELLAILPKPLNREVVRSVLDSSNPEWHPNGHYTENLNVTVEELDAALDAGQLIPFFQPIVSVRDTSLQGLEALVRWAHPLHGVLPPSVFVDHLEEGPLALRFFYHFVEQVCAALIRIHASLPEGAVLPYCGVNLPVPLLNDPDLVDELSRMIAEHRLPASSIVLEVTETTLMSNLAATLGSLARLRLKGFGLAMDDYGTGYSSMKQLSRSPFTELKIDREFVHDAANSPKKLAILTSAISMCQVLHLVSVAEGVENEADWNQLAALGCELAQGYYHSRPLPEASLIDWIRQHPSA